jgi:O-acetyl-ADP-ribose deacetylase (regulator of RNase III)
MPNKKFIKNFLQEELAPKRVGSFVEISGDLIALAKKGKFDFIGHGCNCFAAMGAGIAKSVAIHFPEMKAVDKEYSRYMETWEKLSNFSQCKLKGIPTVGVNFYSQYHPGPDFSKEAFILSMRKFAIWKEELSSDKLWSIGLPLIGCGIAGGDWEEVKKIIKTELSEFDVTIVHFKEK